jgi:hypothetical protein
MKLTRRQILKVIGIAAVGGLGSEAIGQVQQPKPKPVSPTPKSKLGASGGKLKEVLDRLVKDRGFRYTVFQDPKGVLAQQGLTPAEQSKALVRVKIVDIAAFTLAMQTMKTRKSLRATLLNPDKRIALIFGDEATSAGVQVPSIDRSAVTNIRNSANEIGNSIFAQDPFIDIGIGAGPVGPGGMGFSDSSGCVNSGVKCGGGGPGTDSPKCTDNGCFDQWCEDTQGCKNEGCVNETCTDTGCTNPNCSDKKKCEHSGGCIASFVDLNYNELAIKLETALNRGPDLSFIVRAGNRTIRAQTLLNPNALRQALPKTTTPGVPKR